MSSDEQSCEHSRERSREQSSRQSREQSREQSSEFNIVPSSSRTPRSRNIQTATSLGKYAKPEDLEPTQRAAPTLLFRAVQDKLENRFTQIADSPPGSPRGEAELQQPVPAVRVYLNPRIDADAAKLSPPTTPRSPRTELSRLHPKATPRSVRQETNVAVRSKVAASTSFKHAADTELVNIRLTPIGPAPQKNESGVSKPASSPQRSLTSDVDTTVHSDTSGLDVDYMGPYDFQRRELYSHDDSYVDESYWENWIDRHKTRLRWMGALSLICLLVVTILVPLALTVGFSPRSSPKQSEILNGPPGYNTLIIGSPTKDPLLYIPPALQELIRDYIPLNELAVYILNFATTDAMVGIYETLLKEPEVSFMMRDRPLPFNVLFQGSNSTVAPRAQPTDETISNKGVEPILNQTLLAQAKDALRTHHSRGLKGTDDPLWADLWHLQSDVPTSCQAEAAWKTTQGSRDVIVAIVDTGVNYSHPDLQRNIWTNNEERDGAPGFDDDTNGFVDDIHGWDFGCNTSDPMDHDGHGTHVAGLVAAAANNEIGVAGAAPNVKLMALKAVVCGSNGFAPSTLLQAIHYAYINGAHIVSCSFGPAAYPAPPPWDAWDTSSCQSMGGPVICDRPWDKGISAAKSGNSYLIRDNDAWTKALKPLNDAGVVVVAAAGNSALDLDKLASLSYFHWPCTVDLPNVLCVSYHDRQGERGEFSNYGAKEVDVSAPGMDVWSTFLADNSAPGEIGYATLSGTSQAAPLASGAVALVVTILKAGRVHSWSADAARHALQLIREQCDDNKKLTVEYGMINASRSTDAAMEAYDIAEVSAGSLDAVTRQIRVSGLIEEYYQVTSNASVSLLGAQKMGESCRGGPVFPMKSFKQQGPHMLTRLVTWTSTSGKGMYVVNITTDSHIKPVLLINSVPLTLALYETEDLSSYSGVFLAVGKGTYNIELQVVGDITLVDMFISAAQPSYPLPSRFFYISTTTQPSIPSSSSQLCQPGYLLLANTSMKIASTLVGSSKDSSLHTDLTTGTMRSTAPWDGLVASSGTSVSPSVQHVQLVQIPKDAGSVDRKSEDGLNSTGTSGQGTEELWAWARSLEWGVDGGYQINLTVSDLNVTRSEDEEHTSLYERQASNQQSASNFVPLVDRDDSSSKEDANDSEDLSALSVSQRETLQDVLLGKSQSTYVNGTLAWGTAVTMLKPPSAEWNLTLRADCNACRLTLNGLLVLDNWNNVPKASGCIALQSQENTTLILVLRFAAKDISSSPLELSWSPCGNTTWSTLAPYTDTSYLQNSASWQAIASGL